MYHRGGSLSNAPRAFRAWQACVFGLALGLILFEVVNVIPIFSSEADGIKELCRYESYCEMSTIIGFVLVFFANVAQLVFVGQGMHALEDPVFLRVCEQATARIDAQPSSAFAKRLAGAQCGLCVLGVVCAVALFAVGITEVNSTTWISAVSVTGGGGGFSSARLNMVAFAPFLLFLTVGLPTGLTTVVLAHAFFAHAMQVEELATALPGTAAAAADDDDADGDGDTSRSARGGAAPTDVGRASGVGASEVVAAGDEARARRRSSGSAAGSTAISPGIELLPAGHPRDRHAGSSDSSSGSLAQPRQRQCAAASGAEKGAVEDAEARWAAVLRGHMSIRKALLRFQTASGWRLALFVFGTGSGCSVLAVLLVIGNRFRAGAVPADSTAYENDDIFYLALAQNVVVCEWASVCCILALKSVARLNMASESLCEALSEECVGRARDRLAFSADVLRAPVVFSVFGFVVKNQTVYSLVAGTAAGVLGLFVNFFMGI
eukprot:g740.t1